MQVGDLVRFKDWQYGFIGRVTKIYLKGHKPCCQVVWLIGSSESHNTFEYFEDLEVINESR